MKRGATGIVLRVVCRSISGYCRLLTPLDGIYCGVRETRRLYGVREQRSAPTQIAERTSRKSCVSGSRTARDVQHLAVVQLASRLFVGNFPCGFS